VNTFTGAIPSDAKTPIDWGTILVVVGLTINIAAAWIVWVFFSPA
jgi:hypothetical protein